MDDPVFPAKNLDMVIMRSVFHDLENPLSMLENIKKYIKPDSPLVIAEQRHTDFLPIHVITKEHLLSTVSRSSFKLIHIDESLPYRWVIYFFKVDKNKEQNVWKNWLNELHSEVKKIQEMEKDQSISLGKIRIAWERVFESFRDNNPQSEEDERIREYIKERIRSLKEEIERSFEQLKELHGHKKFDDITGPVLRSEYKPVSEDDTSRIFERIGFGYRNFWVNSGDFPNQFEPRTINGDNIIIDKAAGLLLFRITGNSPGLGHKF